MALSLSETFGEAPGGVFARRENQIFLPGSSGEGWPWVGAGWVGHGRGRQPEGPGQVEAPSLISCHAHLLPSPGAGGVFPPPAWCEGSRAGVQDKTLQVDGSSGACWSGDLGQVNCLF